MARPEHPLLSGVRPGPLAVRGSPGPTPPPGLVPPLLAFHHQPCAQGWRSLLPPPMAHVPEPSVHPLSCSGPDARAGCPARERPPSTGPASCISDLPQALQRPHYLCTEAASAHFPEEETEAQRLTLLAQAPRPIGAGLGGGGMTSHCAPRLSHPGKPADARGRRGRDASPLLPEGVPAEVLVGMGLEGAALAALGHVGGCRALPAARAFTLHLQATLGRTAAPTWAAGAQEVRWGRRGRPSPRIHGPWRWCFSSDLEPCGSSHRNRF